MTPQNLPSGAPPRRISVVMLPGGQGLDVVGPVSVFDTANQVRVQSGRPPPYAVQLVAAYSPLYLTGSLQVLAAPLEEGAGAHTALIGGSQPLTEAPLDDETMRRIAQVVGSAERVVSVCGGAFALADLGLLDGRRCTTHWLWLDALRARAPDALVQDDALYTHDGPIHTSAGVTAGVDLALSLLEHDHGPKLALAVARLLVVFLHRPGGQSQFSAAMRRPSTSGRLRALVARVTQDPGGDHRVEPLAASVGMSPRSFARTFKREMGTTPAAFVAQVRLDAARAELERSDDGVDAIAARCGFGSDETLRRHFKRALGISPSDYRARFHR